MTNPPPPNNYFKERRLQKKNDAISWKRFGSYVVRIELRRGPRPTEPIYYEAAEKGERIDIVAKYDEMINKDIEVAYFIELYLRNRAWVVNELLQIMKLIYAKYHSMRNRYRAKYMKDMQKNVRRPEGPKA